MTDQGTLETTWNDLRRAWLRGGGEHPPIHPDGEAPLWFRSARARRAASILTEAMGALVSGTPAG